MTEDFFRGVIAMGYLVAAVFFLKFWRECRDRLFLFFAVAFSLLAAHRPLLAMIGDNREDMLGPYLIRLLAYLIILAGIIDKNLRRS